MLRRLLNLIFGLAFLASTSSLLAQSTVTATVTDSDSQTWGSLNGYNATYSIQLISSAGQPVPSGSAFVSSTGASVTVSSSGNLSSSGALSVSLYNNSAITPAATKWQFTVCPATSSPICATTALTISSSGSVSTQLSAATTAPRLGGGQGAFAYADVEVAATTNNTYYNITTPACRYYSSSWGVCGSGGGSLPTAAATGQALVSTAAGTTYAAQTKVSLDPRDYGADFNGASVTDASTTNGSNVITCPNSDCHFPSNISGYIIFATAGAGTACLDNPAITFGGNNQTTVTGYTNANSITVSGNSNTTATATACLAWFPKDSTTALTSWWNAGGCNGSYMMPPGLTLFSSPIMQKVSGCAAISTGNGYIGQTVFGAGIGSTFLIPAPTFTYTSIIGGQANNCAVGNTNVEDSENFTIYGLGTRATSSLNACLFMVGSASRARNVDGVGWLPRGGGLSLSGIYMQGITDDFEVGGANFFGTYTLYQNSTQQLVTNSYFSGNTAAINAGGGILTSNTSSTTWINDIFQQDVTVDGIVDSQNVFYQGDGETYALYVNGGTMNLLGHDVVNGMDFSSTGSAVIAQNANIATLTGASGNYFYDNGANTLTSVTVGSMIWPSSLSMIGVPVASGNIALGAGFGSSPSASVASNNDERHFTMTVTVGTGAQTQATSTITYTFPRAFNVAPGACYARQVGGTNPALTFFTTTAATTTSVVFTPTAVATASDTIILAVDCQ